MESGASGIRWGTFEDASEEDAFRQRHLDEARSHTVVTILVTTAMAWLSVRNDFLLPSPVVGPIDLLAVRVVHSLVAVGACVAIRRAGSPEALFGATTAWLGATVITKFIVLSARPPEFTGHAAADIVFMLVAPLALPIPWFRQLGAMAAFAISDVIVLLAFRLPLDEASATSRVITYIFAMSLGAMAAHRLQTMMRSEFRVLRLETELRESLVRALSEVRTLRGIVPICCGCHGIRDDEGFWHTVEAYVHANTHADFSHGLCPDCVKKLYPDIAEEVLEAERASVRPHGARGPESVGPPPS